MKTIQLLTMEDARHMAQAAETEARHHGWNVSIAICDAGGHLLWLQRMDGAPLMSAEIAPGKARASVLGGKPGKAYEDMVNNGRTAALSMPIMLMEGGEPLLIDGHVVGAVGVSGVQSAQDAQVARAGIRALDDQTGPRTGTSS